MKQKTNPNEIKDRNLMKGMFNTKEARILFSLTCGKIASATFILS